jgi:hypothetical protein
MVSYQPQVIQMFTFRSTALAISLAISAFAANAAVPTPPLTANAASPASSVEVSPTSAITALPAVKTETQTTPGDDSAFKQQFKIDVVENPTMCGGIPAPRMTPKDGYRTICVNGGLRFINDADQYQYKVTVSRMLKGKKQIVQQFEVTSPLGFPITYSSGNETSYVQSVSTDKETGKMELVPGKVFSGVFVVLDPKSRNENGSVNVETMFDISDLVSIDNDTAPDGSMMQTPNTRGTSEHTTVTVTPGKELRFDSDDLDVSLSVTRLD